MAGLDDFDIDELDELEAMEKLDPTIQNLIDQDSLQWIFVGGKGGVGKTTTSSCIAIQLAKKRESVLIISTDPAHNLSDAFSQKFGKEPTKVNGYDNLYGMEIDPTLEPEEFLSDVGGDGADGGSGGGGGGVMKNLLKEVSSSLPGMDEISSFLEIMKMVKSMKFSCVVFDTAPTGHTLRLLSFPSILESSVGKLMQFQGVGTMISQVTSMMGGGSGVNADDIQNKLGSSRELIENIATQFKDPSKTTFVCVCIPEFLSVYETERLVQELTKFEIDTHNIVVNQLVLKDPEDACNKCKICDSRIKIQKKYLSQVFDLYEDFHIIQMPLLGEEVRGVKALDEFGKYLLTPYPYVHERENLSSTNK